MRSKWHPDAGTFGNQAARHCPSRRDHKKSPPTSEAGPPFEGLAMLS